MQYLNIESTFEGRNAVCNSLLQFLLEPPEGGRTEERSFQLLEALLYRTQLSIFTGRMKNARNILEVHTHTHTCLLYTGHIHILYTHTRCTLHTHTIVTQYTHMHMLHTHNTHTIH